MFDCFDEWIIGADCPLHLCNFGSPLAHSLSYSYRWQMLKQSGLRANHILVDTLSEIASEQVSATHDGES